MKFLIVTCSFFLVPLSLFAQGVSARTGFVDGSVWFSVETLKESQNVKIYSAIFNAEKETLKVDVGFFDNGVALGKKEVYVSPNETQTVSIDWKVTLGSHDIYAEITNAKLGNSSILPERSTTKSVNFSITKDVPVSVAKTAITNQFTKFFNKDNLKWEKIDIWFKENFKKSEDFREAKQKDFSTSKEQVVVDKEKNKDAKVATRTITLLHLYLLVAVSFIFSVSVIFYALTVILCYLVLRSIWRILKRIFRRKHKE